MVRESSLSHNWIVGGGTESCSCTGSKGRFAPRSGAFFLQGSRKTLRIPDNLRVKIHKLGEAARKLCAGIDCT